MKTILMIAFHYPPYAGGSGIHRTVKFSRYLPDHGWQPVVLSASPRAYETIGSDQLQHIPSGVEVARAFALDTARHFAIRGSYLKWMALPDRWVSWWLGAVLTGLRLVRKHRPDLIWSTYPIAVAHLIGLTLHRLTRIPWIADFRDSMTEQEYPSDPTTRSVYGWIERRTVRYCSKAIFTTPGSLRMYAQRYPAIPRSRWAIITNGYDEEDFIAVEQTIGKLSLPNHPTVLVHSGVLYPSERDPRAFFTALAELRRQKKISPANLQIILRGSGSEEFYQQQLSQHGIEDIVFVESALPYHAALAEMLRADGLLVFQAANCNHQIPAKIYEYLRTRRPIFAMTDPQGDTARVLREAGIVTMTPLDSKDQIAEGLVDFLAKVRAGVAPVARDKDIERHSRRSQTEELVKLLQSAT
jgi:glycosyltransferase involved in cell wall biosynthesis